MAASHGMKPGPILETVLYAEDLDAAEQFYRDVLGLEVISRVEGRGVAFRCGEAVLLLFDPERTRLPDAGVPPHGAIGHGHMAFAVKENEIDSWRRHLHRHSVAIEAEVVWPVGGHSIYFRDPGGNVLELAPPALWASKAKAAANQERGT
jgi:catechol 2,3-dioxygenase-like lactoylglutathione lyase family enzyme